jgi:hypothetical protein
MTFGEDLDWGASVKDSEAILERLHCADRHHFGARFSPAPTASTAQVEAGSSVKKASSALLRENQEVLIGQKS